MARRKLKTNAFQSNLYKAPVEEALKRYARGEKPLTHRQFMTVEYYMQGMSKVEAMVKAGYAKTTASKTSQTLFQDFRIQAEIERRRQQRKYKTADMLNRMQEELGRIAFFNIGNFLEYDSDTGLLVYEFSDATLEDLAAVGEVSVDTEYDEDNDKLTKKIKFKPYNKMQAIELLAKLTGIYQETVNHNHGGTVSLEDRLAAGRKRAALKNDDAIEGEFEEVAE